MIGAVPIHIARPRRPHAVPIPLIDFTPPLTPSSGKYDEAMRTMLADFLSRLGETMPITGEAIVDTYSCFRTFVGYAYNFMTQEPDAPLANRFSDSLAVQSDPDFVAAVYQVWASTPR